MTAAPRWAPLSAVGALGRRERRRSTAPVVNLESTALAAASVAFLLSAVVAAVLFWGRELTISGHGSIGAFVSISGAVAAAGAFTLSRLIVQRAADDKSAASVRYRWFDLVALAVGHGAIALLGWIGIAAILERSFPGATLYSSPAVVLAAAATALSAYVAFLSGANLSARQLSLVLAVFLVVGMTTAMLSSQDPQWWQLNLSALGITHDVSSLTFNLTLIISGVMITTIARFGTAPLPAGTAVDRRKRTVVRVLFVLIGVLLACVGIFPVDRFFLLHNTVATGMAVAYAALVIALPWLIPQMPKTFLALGYVYVAATVMLGILFAVGSYNLTAVELVSALMIFSWIIIFLRNVQTVGAIGGAPHGQ